VKEIAMKRTLLILVVLALPAVTSAQPAATDPPVIVTRGTATIKRAPDQAFVTIAAETRAANPGEAQRLSAEAMHAVQSALQKAGVLADAIKTTAYSLSPDTEWVNGRARVRGYVARNQIEVRVDALDRLGPVLDAAGGSGATTIAGLRFDLKDRAGAEREALRLAVEDAMSRARAIAAGAKATVGVILRIEDQVQEHRPIPQMMRMAEQAADARTPITPGEVEITANVTLTVAIR
jgi:uncharacterized protein